MPSKPPSKPAQGKAKAGGAAPGPLMATISGIRGVAGRELTAATVVPFVDAFAHMIGGPRIVIGYDARPSHQWIVPLVEAVVRSHGIDVVQLGLCPTPTVGMMTRKLKAAGGICVTASHNPIEYNGLKFFHSAGEFITGEMLARLKELIATPHSPAEAPRVGARKEFGGAAELHLRELVAALPPPGRARTGKAPRVVIDCCNSAGTTLAPDVADAYGAVIQLLHCDTRKLEFPRGAEPTAENIVKLRRAVVKEVADLGFAIDPDADRLALVDAQGNALGEERTFILAADAFLTLGKRKSPLVVNLSTSMAVDDLAKKHGVKVYRTAIGEANVLAGMRAHKARIGGEGNGGVILPQVQPGRDAATAIALVLMGLQARGGTLADWNATIPDYAMRKTSVPLGSVPVAAALEKVKRAFPREKIETTDGVKVSLADRWVHVRASNTEPIVRVFAEAPTAAGVEELVEKVAGLLR